MTSDKQRELIDASMKAMQAAESLVIYYRNECQIPREEALVRFLAWAPPHERCQETALVDFQTLWPGEEVDP